MSAFCCWCNEELALPPENYEYCPACRGSFSFSKPIIPSEPAPTLEQQAEAAWDNVTGYEMKEWQDFGRAFVAGYLARAREMEQQK